MSDESTTSDEVPVTLSLLEQLEREGLLSETAARRARAIHRTASGGWAWFDRTLLGLGATLFVVGLGFLIAFNWHALPKFGKLGLVQAGIAVCLVTAGLRGLDSNLGNAAVIAGSMLVGVYLAVFGQIYQTGADPWELFAGWAALITGFALLARSQLLWVAWSLLIDLALILFGGQVLTVDVHPPVIALSLAASLGAVNGGLLAAREWRRASRDPAWLRARWPRWLLGTVTLVILAAGAAAFGSAVIFGEIMDDHALQIVLAGSTATILWVGATVAMARYFRGPRHDLGILAIVGQTTSGVAMTWLCSLLVETTGAIGLDIWLFRTF
ncbi:MAG: DUF2157 domain-containing protein, partial [Bradymonadaceae bacterium]